MGRWALFLLLLALVACAPAGGTAMPAPTAPGATTVPTSTAPPPGGTAPASPTTCPPGFPIKEVGGTYVLPGSASYASANPVARCFATEDAARAAGLPRRVP